VRGGWGGGGGRVGGGRCRGRGEKSKGGQLMYQASIYFGMPGGPKISWAGTGGVERGVIRHRLKWGNSGEEKSSGFKTKHTKGLGRDEHIWDGEIRRKQHWGANVEAPN